MSSPQRIAPAPVQTLTQSFEKKLEESQAQIKTHKIAIAIFAILTAIFIAAAVAIITTPFVATLPVSVGAAIVLLVPMAAVGSGVVLVFKIHDLQETKQAQSKLFAEIQLKPSADSRAQIKEKVALFEKHGKLCRTLDFGNFFTQKRIGIGVSQKSYMEWQQKQSLEAETKQFLAKVAASVPVTHQLYRSQQEIDALFNQIKILNLEHQQYALRKAQLANGTLSYSKEQMEKFEQRHEGTIKFRENAFTQQLNAAESANLLYQEDVVQVIQACPNVSKITLGLFESFKVVKEACKKIGYKLVVDPAAPNPWTRDYPGLVD